MSEQRSFDGLCKGGPWDGQRYRHWSDTVSLMRPAAVGPALFRLGGDPGPLTIEAVKFGEYQYDGYGGWLWVSP